MKRILFILSRLGSSLCYLDGLSQSAEGQKTAPALKQMNNIADRLSGVFVQSGFGRRSFSSEEAVKQVKKKKRGVKTK